MIVDFHTHVFPPEVAADRDAYLRRDPTFAEMYAIPKAKLATAEDLLSSMDAAGVDVSVALGFAWRDHEDCVRHNDYLLAAAARSGGRIVPFCTVNPGTGKAAVAEIERCAAAGAKGLGELRPDSQGWDLLGGPGDLLSEAAARLGLILLFHVTEPSGHDYPGKRGLRLASFYRYALAHTGLTLVGAHLAGGLPLELDPSDPAAVPAAVFADTAALRFLYDPALLPRASAAMPGRLLFGSDFPLVSQSGALDDARAGGLDAVALDDILGGSAARLLGPRP